jgi:uncharacterized iron-regulated membrane protein
MTGSNGPAPRTPVPQSAPLYPAFLLAHRWLALVVAVFLVIVAVSGGLLVLEGPIGRARQPHVVPAGSPLPLDTLVQRARAAAGGGEVVMMSLGDSPDLAWSVMLSSRSVLVNPYTGAILLATQTVTGVLMWWNAKRRLV